MRLFNSDGKKVLKAIMRLIEFNYPEAISTLRIVNAPKIFHIVWKVIKGWMHPDTLKKVKVSSGTDVLDDLMDRPLLPTFFGGTLRFGNGEVDESGYLSAVESYVYSNPKLERIFQLLTKNTFFKRFKKRFLKINK